MDIEKYIGMTKIAKDFCSDSDACVRFPNVAKAHINGLSELLLRLSEKVIEDKNKIGSLEDTLSMIRTHTKDEWVIKKVNEVLE